MEPAPVPERGNTKAPNTRRKQCGRKGEPVDQQNHVTFNQQPHPGLLRKGNLVVMSRFQSDNRFSAIQQAIAYWEALRGDALLPRRSDIDPRGIENILEYAFVLERIAPGLARMRVAGSHLSDLMGMEVRGMPITAFFTPAGRAALDQTIEAVFDDPAIVDLALTGERGIGRPPLDARMVLLPMENDLGDVSRIFGCLVAKGDIGRKTRRFDVTATQKRVLGSPAFDTPASTQSQTSGSPAHATPGFAEASPPLAGAKPTRVPYLRIVSRDD
jgi:hypothetical protein